MDIQTVSNLYAFLFNLKILKSLGVNLGQWIFSNPGKFYPYCIEPNVVLHNSDPPTIGHLWLIRSR
jgi:hypothetical protein